MTFLKNGIKHRLRTVVLRCLDLWSSAPSNYIAIRFVASVG